MPHQVVHGSAVNMGTTEEDIKDYFDARHTFEVTVNMLSTFHSITMSTLKTR